MTERLVSTAAESLATWAASVDSAALAPSVVHAAKRCVLDAVACALTGTNMPWVERVLAVARAQESPGRAAVIGRACGLALLLGGATGNVTDRIVNGAVTDFFEVWLGSYHWPAFNVADMTTRFRSGRNCSCKSSARASVMSP